jgi:hypothetical protein
MDSMDKPPKRITDPTFRYTPSVETDIRLTFARIRRERKKAQQEAAERLADNVTPLARVKA